MAHAVHRSHPPNTAWHAPQPPQRDRQPNHHHRHHHQQQQQQQPGADLLALRAAVKRLRPARLAECAAQQALRRGSTAGVGVVGGGGGGGGGGGSGGSGCGSGGARAMQQERLRPARFAIDPAVLAALEADPHILAPSVAAPADLAHCNGSRSLLALTHVLDGAACAGRPSFMRAHLPPPAVPRLSGPPLGHPVDARAHFRTDATTVAAQHGLGSGVAWWQRHPAELSVDLSVGQRHPAEPVRQEVHQRDVCAGVEAEVRRTTAAAAAVALTKAGAGGGGQRVSAAALLPASRAAARLLRRREKYRRVGGANCSAAHRLRVSERARAQLSCACEM
jgi:hypothetical protein